METCRKAPRASPGARPFLAEAERLQSRRMAKVILKDLKKVYPNTEKKKKPKKGEEAAEKKSNLQITDEGVVAVQQRALAYKVESSRDMERQMKTVCGYASLLLRVSMPVERSRENAPVVVFEEKTEHSDGEIDLGDGE